MLYSIADGMKRIDVPENHKKNRLPIGTVLHLNGYNNPDYVIVKNRGVDPNYGAMYDTISLDDYGQSQKRAYELKYLSERTDGRIQTYITDEVKSSDEVLSIWEKSEQKRKSIDIAKEKAEQERQVLIAKGKILYDKYIPSNAKALIIATHEIDDCDTMTDYFNTKNGETVILGWSTHTRDLFSEMRKHAHKINETKHLAVKPVPGPDDDKEFWRTPDEHREKYSMGAGYYLKDANRYSTGWKIEKNPYYMKNESMYISIAKRCVFTDKPEAMPVKAIKNTTVTLNEEKQGIEITFPGKPSEAIRDALKTNGFRWSRNQGLWYTKQSPAKIKFAESLTKQEE